METVFAKILNMSLTASIVIAVVLLARLALKKAPKIYSYALWAVVLFRLLCPVSIQAPVSVLQVTEPEVVRMEGIATRVSYLPAQAVVAEPQVQRPAVQNQPAEIREDHSVTLSAVAAFLWAAGAAVMLLRSIVEYLQLRSRLIGSVLFRGNVYLADHISTAFVLGLFRPKIYLPSHIPGHERRYIVAHERHHIRRGDHIIKLLAYVALSIHWFNPLVWVAFVQAGKDMEMSCDEAVIRQLGSGIRADYSASLLRLAARHRIIGGTPLAFGEGDTKGRIRNMAKWKKPKLWVSLLCALLSIAILAACAVNPAGKDDGNTAGSLKIAGLPTGYSYETDEDGNTIFTYGSDSVGGITQYPIPEGLYDPKDTSFLWLEEMGIPDFEDPSLCYMGGMTAANGGWLAEFASDVPPGAEVTVNRRHHFYVVGDTVYDIWFDMLKMDLAVSEDIRKAVTLPGSPAAETEEKTTEDLAFEKVKAVLDMVQTGSYQIQVRQENEGNEGPSGYLTTYFSDGDNWLRLHEVVTEGTNQTEAGDYYNRMAHLIHKDFHYSNDGHWADRGAIQWTAITEEEMDAVRAGRTSMLASFLWVRSYVTYMDTLTDDSGQCMMFRVDKTYAEMEGYDGHYFANFYFDPNGNFRELKLQVNLYQDNAFTVTESIVTLDTETVAAQIESYYSYGIPVPQAEGSPVEITAGAAQIQYGSLTMTLPEGYTCWEEDGTVILAQNGADVGGITSWPTPQEELTFPGHNAGGNMAQWVRALGLPEAQESEEPIGHMIEGSLYGDLQAEFFNELAPEKLNVQHHFFIDGAIVYDVYYNQNLLSDAQAETFLKTIAVSGEPVVTPAPSEADALEKCKAVLDMVQGGSSGISAVRENTGNAYLNKYSNVQFWQQGDNWMEMVEIPESGSSSFLWYMEVDGVHYNSERTGWDENGPIWAEQKPVEVNKPWLLTFRWDAAVVTYEATLFNGGEETVMLRIDEPYPYGEDNTDCYFVSFTFAGNTFLSVKLQVNLFLDNGFDTTERILTLDVEEVSGQIEKEHTRALENLS